MMNTLYITNDCPGCDRVIDFLKSGRIDIAIVNVSDPGKQFLKPGVVIFPALLTNNRLVAYGDDIIKKLSTSIKESGIVNGNQTK